MIDPRIAVVGAALIVSFASGWITNGWRHDAEELAVQTAAEKAFNAALFNVNGISAKLQATTDALDKKRMVTTKEIFHETTKIEYRCILPESGRLLYNSAAAETAVTGEP
jgi:tellurite resistance protein